ncbi:hypothetical protein ES703_52925 [subsurface metagenome]
MGQQQHVLAGRGIEPGQDIGDGQGAVLVGMAPAGGLDFQFVGPGLQVIGEQGNQGGMTRGAGKPWTKSYLLFEELKGPGTIKVGDLLAADYHPAEQEPANQQRAALFS